MNCSICQKEVQLNDKFISGFTPEKLFFVTHAKCAGVRDQQAKTMSQLRLDSIATYHANQEKKAAEKLAAQV